MTIQKAIQRQPLIRFFEIFNQPVQFSSVSLVVLVCSKSNPPTHQHHPAHQPLMILLFLFTSRARILNNDATEETGETRIGTLPIQADPLLRVPFHPQKQSHFIVPRPSRCFCFYWLIYWTHSYGHSVALHTPYRYIRNSWIINSPKLLEFLRLLLHHPLTIFYLRLCCFKGKSSSISSPDFSLFRGFVNNCWFRFPRTASHSFSSTLEFTINIAPQSRKSLPLLLLWRSFLVYL